VEQATVWWTSALRFLGCTGHAFHMAVVFGDEIELRATSMRADFANPFDVMRLMAPHAGPGTSGVRRLRSVLSVVAGGKKAAEMNFRTACEVADVFAKRLGLDEDVRASLAASFERWNGRGLPARRKGREIPRPMRIAQVSQELEVLARIEGIDRALDRGLGEDGRSPRPARLHEDRRVDAWGGCAVRHRARDPDRRGVSSR
jgi:hypothetical protein